MRFSRNCILQIGRKHNSEKSLSIHLKFWLNFKITFSTELRISRFIENFFYNFFSRFSTIIFYWKMKTFFQTSTIFTKIFLIFFCTYFSSKTYIKFKFFAPLFQMENWTRYFSVRVLTKRTVLCWALAPPFCHKKIWKNF